MTAMPDETAAALSDVFDEAGWCINSDDLPLALAYLFCSMQAGEGLPWRPTQLVGYDTAAQPATIGIDWGRDETA